MLERAGPWLKWVAAALAAVLVIQVAGAMGRLHPLKRNSVPEPPTWSPAQSPPAPTGAAGGGGPGPGGPPGAPSMPVPGGMPPGAMKGRGGRPVVALSPEVEGRIARVIDSEVLAPVMRPPPMALLGIAGPDVFLRAPNGQVGLVRAGGELGGVRLLQVGTNRVLVQEGTETKELTIFNGIGGESLMPKAKEGTP